MFYAVIVVAVWPHFKILNHVTDFQMLMLCQWKPFHVLLFNFLPSVKATSQTYELMRQETD
jgi:hypothetical protein